MKALQTIVLAGLTSASLSAQAGFINYPDQESVIIFPQSVSLDINADPETFTIPFTGDPRDGFSNGISVPTVLYFLENDIFYARFDDTGYNDNTINFGLQLLFAAQRPFYEAEAVGKETILGPLLDQTYTYSVRFNYYELVPCDTAYGLCEFGFAGSVDESTQISFFDGSAQEVPVGPTAPLLLAGLAGLWLRKRSAK